MITKDDASVLLDLIRVKVIDPDPSLVGTMGRLRDMLVDDEDEPETGELENVLKKIDLSQIPPTGVTIALREQADEYSGLIRSLATNERIFVVEEGVRAGDVPPDELVFRKAQR